MWKEESTPPRLLKRAGKKPKTEKCRVRKAKNGLSTQRSRMPKLEEDEKLTWR